MVLRSPLHVALWDTPAITLAMESLERFANPNGRRYKILVQHDLFGGLEIVRIWSASSSARGGYKVDPMSSMQECERRLTSIRSVRRRRGYVLVESSTG